MENNGSVERARDDYEGYSRQTRFTDGELEQFYLSTYAVAKMASLQEPDYRTDSRKRDEWMLEFVRREPNLQGVLNAVVTIDKNRGWRFTGGRNQVARFTRMLHNIESAPGQFGWRPAMSQLSQSFWGTDMGAVVELGREGADGPLRAMYTVDPTECVLTGNNQYPLEHFTSKRKKNRWRNKDFFRVASLPTVQEKYNGLGYCAVSRVLEMAKIMVAVHEHDKEELGARAPRGLLLLQGVSQDQWDNAMRIRDAKLDGDGYQYFNYVSVLASKNAPIDAKLFALSQLPKNFNMKDWVDILMYTYALSFGYDPAEFWPIQFGALGRGEEGSLQHEKATGKGRLDFVLGFQEQLQEFLPDTLEFAFDQRDDKGNLIKAQVNQAWINNIKTLYEIGVQYGAEGLISRDQALILLADYGVIPRSWSPSEILSTTDLDDSELNRDDMDLANQDVVAPSADDMKARYLLHRRNELRERPHIWRCAEEFPHEPIVEYSYPEDKLTVLWDRAEQIHSKGGVG